MSIVPATTPLEVTDDAFLGGRVMLRQPSTGYRAGLDAVLLAATVPAPATRGRALRVLDAGAGVGTVGVCVAARLPDAEIVLIERDPVLAALARENARRNGFESRVSVVTGDVLARASAADHMPHAGSFDHVLANPPYHEARAGTRSADARKDAAHAMDRGALEGWARFLARMTAPGGLATLIHKADALAELLECLSGRFGKLTILPIHPRAGEAASRVIVQGRKGSRAALALLSGLVLHGEGHGFTLRAEAILRHGAGLDLEK